MKKFKSYILVAMMGLSVTSCEDFLTLMPLNEVVLENFYTNEADVESVLRSAYAALESSDCIVRMSAWGEMRSDNLVDGSDNSSNGDDDLVRFINENINYQNSLTKYLCFYKAINYANTVLYYAPEVHRKDPNYHGSELAVHQAEAISIRCLSYWYLIRAFKDVPYTTRPSIDDTEDFFIGQSSFDSILDCLIEDLEKVKDLAPIHYSSDLTKKANTARFTRAAIYAMLADMYLWKGEWGKCDTCCMYITESKKDDYKKIKADKGMDCDIDPVTYNEYPLILEVFGTTDDAGNAYNAIFGQGNSFESIFELPFDRTTSNPFVSSYYNSSSSTTGKLKASDKITRGEKSDDLFAAKDVRFYQNIASDNNQGIVKYVYSDMKYNLSGGDSQTSTGTRRGDNAAEPGWIIYRYTDVLLMQAEALTMQARDLKTQGGSAADVNAKLQKAFDIVNAVNMRATCYPKYGETQLTYVPNNDPDVMEDLVFDERRRELMFEGKRWFDLVRQALRNGSALEVSNLVRDKSQNSNGNMIAVKFSNLNGLFLPINKDEMDINPRLKQNSAYSDNEHIKKAK